MSTQPISSSNNQASQELKTEELGKKVISYMASKLPDLSSVKEIELTEALKEQLIFKALEQMKKKGEEVFTTQESLDSPQFFEFLSEGFLKIMTTVIKEAEHLPANNIVECHVNEAVFTHALDRKPIAATDSLATCVGVAGYDSENKFGFVFHIATEAEFETSKEMLTEKIMQMSKKTIITPIEIHIRGGIAGLSEPLVEAIEKWVQSASEEGCPMVVISKDVLGKGLLDQLGKPNTMNLSLDTRNGEVSIYDSSTNPYAKQKIEINNEQEFDNVLSRIFTESAIKKPEIKVVYFPSN